MSVLDALLNCIDTFSDTIRLLKINFFVILVSFFIQIITFSTRGWVALSLNGDVVGEEGLWEHCDETSTYICCESLDSYLYKRYGGIPGWVHGSRAFQVIGFLVGLSTLVITILCTFIEKTCRIIQLDYAGFTLNFVTAVSIFLSLVIYGSGYNGEVRQTNAAVAGSFIVTIFVMFAYISNGILMIFAIRQQKVRIGQIAPAPAPSNPIQVAPANQANTVVTTNAPIQGVPGHWDDMGNSNTKVVTLPQSSGEYKQVATAFTRSLGSTNVNIISIERIQIKSLYTQYIAKREQMKQALKNMKMSQIEKQLWHGTSATTVESIVTYGFNRSYCGKNATMYGEGVYFARDASYSAQTLYSPPDSYGYSKIFHCGVLVGEYTTGKQNMRVPPPKSGHILYDSTVDNTRNPGIFVVYHDTQAYPEHLITFKR